MIAAVYARKSTDQHDVAADEKSATRQLDQARAYATAHGFTADEHIYVDDGISGSEFAKRPGLVALLNALKPRPPFQVLLIADADRLGREQIDALQRKAERGYVTGGTVYGYDNVVVTDAQGRRSHVVRQVNPEQAAVVRRLFALTAEGRGHRLVAHQLNAEGAPAPRPRRPGGPTGWAPSSVRAILHRTLYTGDLVWGQRRKRDQWGQHRVSRREQAEWVRSHDESLRILSEAEWTAAHDGLAGTRQAYLRGTGGQLWGRPCNGHESRYLLVGLAHCGWCGGTMEVHTRDWKHRRKP
jgi:DNA invertase Pin-like site-specific DNA recombinase